MLADVGCAWHDLGALGTTGIYRPPMPPSERLERAGAQMRRIRTSKPGVTWLQGPGPCDFWTYKDEAGAIMEQELTFFGHTVVKRGEKLHTGLCHEGVSASVLGKTGLLDFDRALDPVTLGGAAMVLDRVPDRFRSENVERFLEAIKNALDGKAVAS